jgi:hypothetical protein
LLLLCVYCSTTSGSGCQPPSSASLSAAAVNAAYAGMARMPHRWFFSVAPHLKRGFLQLRKE